MKWFGQILLLGVILIKKVISTIVVSSFFLTAAIASNDKIPFAEQFDRVHFVEGADPVYPSDQIDPAASLYRQPGVDVRQILQPQAKATSNVEPNPAISGFLERNRAACNLIAEWRGFDLTTFHMDIEDCPADDEVCLDTISDILLRFDRIEREFDDIINEATGLTKAVSELSQDNMFLLRRLDVVSKRVTADNVEIDALSRRVTAYFRPSCEWRKLGWDMTKLIALWVDPASAKNFALVCKAFSNAVNQRSHLRINPVIPELSLIRTLSTKPQIMSLCLADCGGITEPNLIRMLRSYPRLRSLNLDRCGAVNGNVLNAISTSCPEIHSLSIRSFGKQITMSSLVTFLATCLSLRTLDILGNTRFTTQEDIVLLNELNPNLLITRGIDPNAPREMYVAGGGITADQALIGAAVIGVGIYALWNLFKEPRHNNRPHFDRNDVEYSDSED
jgi:hypothetical protein